MRARVVILALAPAVALSALAAPVAAARNVRVESVSSPSWIARSDILVYA